MNDLVERLTVEDARGVCYRQGRPTVADYNEAITDLLAAKHQIQSGSLMGCDICGDSGHAPQDAHCRHDPLLLARKWTAATEVYQCWHCGYVATTSEEATAHFGKRECDPPACLSTITSLEERVEELEAENFRLAAGVCIYPNGEGLLGDEHGNSFCSVERERQRLAEQVIEIEARTLLSPDSQVKG